MNRLGFKRLVCLYDMCLHDEKSKAQNSRWTGAWITWNMARMLGGIKDSWPEWAVSLGVIDQEKKDYYSRKQRKEDLAKVDALASKFAAFEWSDPDVQQ